MRGTETATAATTITMVATAMATTAAAATTMATTAATTITTTTSTTGLVGASSGAFSVVAGHSTNPEWGTSRQSHLLPRVELISDSDCRSSYSLIAQVGAYKITLILSAKVFIMYHSVDRCGWRTSNEWFNTE